MAGSAMDLMARFLGDVSSFKRALQEASTGTSAFAQTWSKTSADIATAATRIGAVVGGVVSTIVAGSASMGFAFNASKESAAMMLQTMLKDGPTANKVLKELVELAKDTPFGFEGLQRGIVNLAIAKVKAEDLVPMLQKISDGIAMVGGGDEQIRAVTLALSQMMNAGKVNAQDMNQLINVSVDGWGILAQHFGKTVGEIRAMSEKGLLNGRESALVIIEQMGKDGAGASKQLAQQFKGAWSTIADNARGISADIFHPLYVGVTDIMVKINNSLRDDGDKGTVEAVKATVTMLTEAVENITFNLKDLAETNGPATIKAIADGLLFMAEAGGNVLEYLRAEGPALMQTAAGFMSFLKPIAMYLSQHPQLIAALVGLKVTGMLGLNQALYSVMSALISTIAQMLGLSTAAGTATASVGGLSSGMSALKGLGIAAVILGIAAAANMAANEFSGINKEVREANAQMSKMDALAGERRALDRSRRRDETSESEIADPAARKAALQQQLDIAQKNATGLRGQARGAQASADDTAWGAQNVATKILSLGMQRGGRSTNANDEAADIARIADEAEAEVRRIQQDLANIERAERAMAEKKAKQESSIQIQSEFIGPQVATPDQMAKQTEVDKALKAHRDDGRNAELPGYNTIRDFLEKGGSHLDVKEFAGNMKSGKGSVSPELAEQLARLYSESERTEEALDALALAFSSDVKAAADFEKRCDIVGDKVEGFNEKLLDMGDVVPDDAIQNFRQDFERLGYEFRGGQIDADAYRDSLKNLDNRMRDAKQSGIGVTTLGESIDEHATALGKHEFGQNGVKGLSQSTAANAAQKFDAIHAEAEKLAESFNAGKLSAAQFSIEMNRLKKATDDVTDAAIKEEQEKRKQALIQGNWQGAGLDPGKAIQDEIASRQQSFFQTQITNFVDNLFGINQYMQPMVDGFGNLVQGMTGFGQALSTETKEAAAGGGKGDSGGPSGAEAQSIYNSIMNTVAGQIAQIQNAIAMHVQALQFLQDADWQRKQLEINAIESLTHQISMLEHTVSTFNGRRSNDPIFKDPGITGGGQQYTIHNNINIPNVQNFSQADIDHLANSLANSWSRQGGPAFS